jgi:glutaconate CoA-transferase subunit A
MSFAGSTEIDLLVGAGCASVVSSAYVGLGRSGPAPAFKRAVEEGSIDDREYSEWTMLGGLRASAMGIPFMPTRGGTGSQLLDHLRPETVVDPYGTGTYLAIPPIIPDVAVIHAWRGGTDGSVQFAAPPEHLWDVDVVAARAARTTIVTVEEMVPEATIAEQPQLTVLLGVDVDMVVECPGGSWPTACLPVAGEDHEAVSRYASSGDIEILMGAR